MLPNDKLEVLVVEDSHDDVFLLQRHVRKLRAPRIVLHVEHTAGGALTWLERHTPDAILLDLSLPDVVGPTDALVRLRRTVPAVPVVVLTGSQEHRLAAEALRLGAQDFVSKAHIDADRLLRVLRHALERNRLQQKLRERRDSFSSIVDHSPEGILVVGADQRIRYANPAAGEMLGKPCEELLGAPMLWGNDDTLLFDLPIQLPSGEPGIGQAHFAETVWAGEGAELVTIRDVTRRRRAEEALREHNQRLERVRRMEAVGLLAGGVAHEFNNQLMVIQGFAELARATLDESHDIQGHLDRILVAARRSAAITTQLMSLSRRPSLAPQPTLLAPLLEEAEGLLAPLLGERITLLRRVEVPDAIVVLDASEVQQVLMNLAVNARDAMPGGGTLELGLRAGAPGWVTLWVRDTGVGMDDETQTRAFEPFFTTKEVGKGTGLGLSTVYGLAQRWGATVELDSTLGEGTTISLSVPLSSLSPAPPPEAAAAPRGLGEHVLVVEDEEAVREYLRAVLTEQGYRVTTAPRPDRVLQAPPRPDIIVSDVVMPGMSGPQMVAELRAQGIAAPVLYLSGYSDRQSAGDAGLSPDDAVLQKPVDVHRLLSCVRERLAQGAKGR